MSSVHVTVLHGKKTNVLFVEMMIIPVRGGTKHTAGVCHWERGKETMFPCKGFKLRQKFFCSFLLKVLTSCVRDGISLLILMNKPGGENDCDGLVPHNHFNKSNSELVWLIVYIYPKSEMKHLSSFHASLTSGHARMKLRSCWNPEEDYFDNAIVYPIRIGCNIKNQKLSKQWRSAQSPLWSSGPVGLIKVNCPTWLLNTRTDRESRDETRTELRRAQIPIQKLNMSNKKSLKHILHMH